SVSPHRSVERLDVRSIGRIVKAVAKAQGLRSCEVASTPAASCLWHALPRSRNATAGDCSNARARPALNRADLHAGFRGTDDADLQGRPPARTIPAPGVAERQLKQ